MSSLMAEPAQPFCSWRVNAGLDDLTVSEESLHPKCEGVPVRFSDGMEAEPTHVP